MNIIYLIITVFICCSAGLVTFAVFADCDPRSARLIGSNDQVGLLNVEKMRGFRRPLDRGSRGNEIWNPHGILVFLLIWCSIKSRIESQGSSLNSISRLPF